MTLKQLGAALVLLILTVGAANAQESVYTLLPFNGDPARYVDAQFVADTTATNGLLANRVYELKRDSVYLTHAILTIQAGETLRLRAEAGAGKKPIIYLWETGTGGSPTRPPGNFTVLNGGNLEVTNVCIAGYYEPEPDRVDGVQGGLINTTAAGSSIILDGVVFSNINGQHVRTGSNSVKVSITNSIFANMGSLSTSNFGAGKGIDLRDVSCDSLIIQNNTFVNYQDRPIRHYNFGNPLAGTGPIGYGLIDHNTFINGMGFHGLFSLGNIGNEMTITNNLFIDAFALGEDSTDATRAAEWANTGEVYASNGQNRITWIFSAPNDTTQWRIHNNYFSVSDSGQAFLTARSYPIGSKLSWHINTKLQAQGGDSTTAFQQVTLGLGNIPKLMTVLMRWYEAPNGGGRIKDQTNYDRTRDDYDRRPITYYRDTLDGSYSNASAAYTGGVAGFPVGDLNWFPTEKAQWLVTGVEQGSNVIPDVFTLDQNYPNPFNPATKIVYGLPTQARVKLEVYDLLGRVVATLVDNQQQAGQHTVEFDGSKLPSGFYIYRLSTPNQTIAGKMVLIK